MQSLDNLPFLEGSCHMKNIDLKSFLIGFFMATTLLLAVGASKESSTECAILSPFKGKPFCGNQLLEIGSSYISPYSNSCEIESEEESSLLITDFFSH